MMTERLLKRFGIASKTTAGKKMRVVSPIDGASLAEVELTSSAKLTKMIETSMSAFHDWRLVPAPKRGELVRLFGNALRTNKVSLAELLTLECGKIVTEALGEVQEMIDICDFAVGLSRQLYGLTIASERKEHRMQETWLPLGPVAVISAFNFPVAVWAWNFALAIVCGNAVIWKPSEKTPLVALACQDLFLKTIRLFESQGGHCPSGLSQLVLGDRVISEQLVTDPRIALVSATGSTQMGLSVGKHVAARFGRSLLELGGNNAVIVSDKADLNLAVRSVVFGAVGTAGQRCTTTRRAIVHQDVYDNFLAKVETAYGAIAARRIGDPRKKATLVGPLIDEQAFLAMRLALKQATSEGGTVLFGKRVHKAEAPQGFYVEPALVKIKRQTVIVKKETFAPILYVMPYNNLSSALDIQNDVPQGLASAIFTQDISEAEYFRTHCDCGIANVNIGTSGAEIGGAFGGEKETGGGRESGSDAWKNYMRRQTSTLYFGTEPPALAQGLSFDVG